MIAAFKADSVLNMKELNKSSCYQEEIDPKSVLEFLNRIEKILEPHGVVMIKNGKVILDAKWAPYDTHRPHVVNSVTKTFIGIAIGLLYDRKQIHLEDKLTSYFPEIEIDPKNEKIKDVTIKNVMTMSMGQIVTPVLDKDRSWVSALLNNPLSFEPGSRFHYDSLATYLLSAVYTKITGETVSAGLKRDLFEPLGIDSAYFFDNPQGITIGGLGLFIPTKDLAKVGYLLVSKGVYQGKRILSEEWCEMQLSKQIINENVFPASKHESRQGYGLQCWHCVNGGIRMSGLWGQMCLMMPKYDFVMAINARGSSSQPILDIFNETVLLTLQGKKELSGQDELDEYLKDRKTILPKNPFVSFMKEEIDRRPVSVKDDLYGVESFKVSFEDAALRFEVVRQGKTFQCVYGHNELIKSTSDLIDCFPPYYDSLSKPKAQLLNYHQPYAYGQYYWEDEGTLRLVTLYDNEATHFEIRLHYDYQYAAFEWNSITCCTKYEHVLVHGKYKGQEGRN